MNNANFEVIIEKINIEGTLIQLTYHKYREGYNVRHFKKKGNYIIDVKSIEIANPTNIKHELIDFVETEEMALVVLKKFQRAFKKQTGISLRKSKGVNTQGFYVWMGVNEIKKDVVDFGRPVL